MNWLDDLKIEDLPEQYQEMAAIIGIEATLKLVEHYRGIGFYFRSLGDLIAEKKKQFIIRNFTGTNYAELARATGYSERWVRALQKNGKDDRQPEIF